jgi:NAD-dependent dihydropyrimidine dehydrogenase PreA subunit/flavodoxin
LEEPDKKSAALVYLSPQGTTRKAGRMIAALLDDRGYSTSEFDLSRVPRDGMREVARKAVSRDLLVIGSPVYSHHPLRPVLRFIESLPVMDGKPALVFATFGGVTKGVALFEMASMLAEKGYRVKGAAQVLAVHSMMFREKNPVGNGHPRDEDRDVLAEWVDRVAERLGPDNAEVVDVETLRRRGAVYRVTARYVMAMGVVGKVLPRVSYHQVECDDCGACKERCPVGRLDVIPEPPRSDDCLKCYECVRVCPQGAMDAPMFYAAPMVRMVSKVEGRHGEQFTKYYV